MHRLFAPVAVLLLCGAATHAQQPTHKIEATDRQKVNATLTYELRTTNFAATKWMIFLPEPPELPSQGKVKTTANPAGKLLTEKSLLGRKVRYVEIAVGKPTPGAGASMKMDVEAVLRSRRLVELEDGETPPAVAPLAPAERKYYLSATTHLDHDARAFQDWLDAKKLRRTKAEGPLDFAARVLEVIRADYTYRFGPDEDKRASVACAANRTDCGGMAYLFAAAMRANDAPARVLVGRLALPREPGTDRSQLEYDRPHIRAEVFVTGVGWVPVDPANAHSGKSKPVTAFVGHDPGDLLVLHVDVDLRLPYPDKEREVQFIQVGPSYWATGTGKFDGQYGPTGWDLKAAAIEKK